MFFFHSLDRIKGFFYTYSHNLFKMYFDVIRIYEAIHEEKLKKQMFKESKNIKSAKKYNRQHVNIKQKRYGTEPKLIEQQKRVLRNTDCRPMLMKYKIKYQFPNKLKYKYQYQILQFTMLIIPSVLIPKQLFYQFQLLQQFKIAVITERNMTYMNGKFKEQHTQFIPLGTPMQKYHHPIKQMLQMAILPQKLKARELNFENIYQVVLFFRNWKSEPASLCQQMRDSKWSDTEISTFCFNCQFVQYLVDLHAQLNGQDSSQPSLKQIKHWYRKLSLYIQKQSIKITKHDLKKSDIKNLQQIYSQSRNFINNFKQRSQTITEYSQNVLNLTKCILTTKKYEKLSIITFALSFTAMFIILCTLQYINVINEILLKSNMLTGEHKAKLVQMWSISSITGMLINSLIIVITLFFIIKKFSTYFEIAFTKLSGLENESKGKQNCKEQIIKNKR